MLPVSSSVNAVFFAIRSAVKLGRQVRRVYVDNLRNRELNLPFINFPGEPDFASAKSFFEGGGSSYMDNNPRIKELYEKALNSSIEFESKDGREFMLLFNESWAICVAEEKKCLDQGVDAKEIADLMAYRQWKRDGEDNPSALQRISGALIEIGIDYFVNIPGALQENSAHSKVLKGFLAGIEDVNFSEAHLDLIAKDLFVATIESIAENPELLTGDENTQVLIAAVSKGIVQDVENKIKEIQTGATENLAVEERIQGWAQLVFRSVLTNSGHIVLSNPHKFLDTPEGGESEMISAVGNALLDGLISDKGEDIAGIFNRASLDKVTKAAMVTLANHPELVGPDKEHLKQIIAGVAKEIGESSRSIDTDLLPEVMRLILEKSAGNLEYIWPEGSNVPQNHLLITAAKHTLEAISVKPEQAGDGWKPSLTGDDAKEILEFVFDEVIQNPDWLYQDAQEVSPLLENALNAVFESINNIPKENRIGPETVKGILKSTIQAIAMRKKFLEVIPVEETGDKQYLINFILDTIFDLIFTSPETAQSRWVLARGNVLSILVDTILNKVAIEGVRLEIISKIMQILKQAMRLYETNKRFSMDETVNQINLLTV